MRLVAPTLALIHVCLRDAEQRKDDFEWKRYRELRHQIRFVLTREPIDEPVGDSADLALHRLQPRRQKRLVQGYYQKAEECFQRGLALWEQLEFPHPCTARIFNGLASLCIRQGKHSEAEVYYRRAIAFWEQLYFQYPLVSESLYGLALLLIERGNDAEAEPLLQRALYIRAHWLGKAHPETLATAASYQDLLAQMHRKEEQREDTASGTFR